MPTNEAPTDGETLAALWRVADAAREVIEARDEMSKMGSELEKSENIWQVFSSRPRTIARWLEAETELRAALAKLPEAPARDETQPPAMRMPDTLRVAPGAKRCSCGWVSETEEFLKADQPPPPGADKNWGLEA